jgi:hypothetical protein
MSLMLPTTINLSCPFAWEFKGAEQSVAVVATARILTREGFDIAIASWRMRRTEFDRFHRIQTGASNGGDLTTRESNSNSIVSHAKIHSFGTRRMHRNAESAENVGMPGTWFSVDCPLCPLLCHGLKMINEGIDSPDQKPQSPFPWPNRSFRWHQSIVHV